MRLTILVYKTDGVSFLLANDLKPVLPKNTIAPHSVTSVDIDWPLFKEWHRKEMNETIHPSIRKAYLIDKAFAIWIYKYSKEISVGLLI